MKKCQTNRHCLRLIVLAVFSIISFFSSAGLSENNNTCSELQDCENKLRSYFKEQKFDQFQELYLNIEQTSADLTTQIEDFISYDLLQTNFENISKNERLHLIKSYSSFREYIQSSADLQKPTFEFLSDSLSFNLNFLEFSVQDASTQFEIVKDLLQKRDWEIAHISHYISISNENKSEFLIKLVNDISWDEKQMTRLLIQAIMNDSTELFDLTRTKIGNIDPSVENVNQICAILDAIFPESDAVEDSDKIFNSKTMKLFFESLSDEEKQTVCVGKIFVDTYLDLRQKYKKIAAIQKSDTQHHTGYKQEKPFIETFKEKKFEVTLQIQESCNKVTVISQIESLRNKLIPEVYDLNTLQRADQEFFYNKAISENCHIQISIRKSH